LSVKYLFFFTERIDKATEIRQGLSTIFDQKRRKKVK
jgi:hypothetical protein